MNSKRQVTPRKMLWICTLLSAAALMTACGGGGGGGDNGLPVVTAGAGATVQGPISGFGSVIVNGIRFDDSAASVKIDDDDDDVRHNSSELKLGMMVEIESKLSSSSSTSSSSATASSITATSHVQGPISAINANAGTVTVLGLTISLKASTIFEGFSALTNLQAGDFIEVYGLENANGLLATRVEKKTGTPELRLVGALQNLDTTAKTFTLRGITINYQNAKLGNVTLANDTLVRVKGTLVNNIIVASKVKAAKGKPSIKEAEHAELEGLVSNFVSMAQFEVLGMKVDASKLSPAVALVNGTRVEVEGVVTNGVLIASKIEVKNDAQEAEIELHGMIENFSASAQTFFLRSGTVQVHWSGSTSFIAPLTAATLGNTVKVEIKGTMVNGIVQATRIKVDN